MKELKTQKEREFLEKISGYFFDLSSKDGNLICPKHKIEHTGKNIYSAVIDTRLYELTANEEYYNRIKKRVKVTLGKLIKDPEYGYWIFYPGRLNRWNMSNSIIDAGACVDVLSSFYLKFFNRLSLDERKDIKEAIFRNSDTYLKQNILTKDVINQRLWGGTGLSSAYKIFKNNDWKEALLSCVNKSLSFRSDCSNIISP